MDESKIKLRVIGNKTMTLKKSFAGKEKTRKQQSRLLLREK